MAGRPDVDVCTVDKSSAVRLIPLVKALWPVVGKTMWTVMAIDGIAAESKSI